MRRAYGVDKLISAGFTGAGNTIVIVDAFQSPNIVQELNFYNSFYGLPSMNGLGAPNNPNLPTFTQVAPDGLTAFVPGDPNMTGWAEEIMKPSKLPRPRSSTATCQTPRWFAMQ